MERTRYILGMGMIPSFFMQIKKYRGTKFFVREDFSDFNEINRHTYCILRTELPLQNARRINL